MKIFLTGGSGFIGSSFINIALSSGHEIIAINRKKTDYNDVEGLVWIAGDLSGDYQNYFALLNLVKRIKA